MKATRMMASTIVLAGALTFGLTGCGDNDNEIFIDNPEPTSTAANATPVPTPTSVAQPTSTDVVTATATPDETPSTDVTPTPSATAAPCNGPEVVVQVDIDSSYGAARIDLQYPGTDVNIPGSGTAQSVVDRVDFAANGGLTTVNDDDNTSTLTASFVAFSEQPGGAFLTVTFDCVAGTPAASAFTCTVVSASTPGGVAIPGVGCSATVQ
jgi:hypothetical protein